MAKTGWEGAGDTALVTVFGGRCRSERRQQMRREILRRLRSLRAKLRAAEARRCPEFPMTTDEFDEEEAERNAR